MNIFISVVRFQDQNHTCRHQTLLALNQIEGEINFVSLFIFILQFIIIYYNGIDLTVFIIIRFNKRFNFVIFLHEF